MHCIPRLSSTILLLAILLASIPHALCADPPIRFGPPQVIAPFGTAEVSNIQITDVNGDGLNDFITFPNMIWFENTGLRERRFIPHFIPKPDLESQSMIAADLDGDGDMDIVIPYSGPGAIWLENQNGTFVQHPLSDRKFSFEPVVIDMNGDGFPDIVMGNTSFPTVFINDGGTSPTLLHMTFQTIIANSSDSLLSQPSTMMGNRIS